MESGQLITHSPTRPAMTPTVPPQWSLVPDVRRFMPFRFCCINPRRRNYIILYSVNKLCSFLRSTPFETSSDIITSTVPVIDLHARLPDRVTFPSTTFG
jgi:hypothetical protein